MPSFTVVPTTAKLPIAAMMKGPGPAKYGLPSCLGLCFYFNSLLSYL